MTNWTHHCNAYCDADTHCDMFRLSPNANEGKIAQLLGYYQGLRVRKAEPAREPFPATGTEPVFAGTRDDATEPWLVWWER